MRKIETYISEKLNINNVKNLSSFEDEFVEILKLITNIDDDKMYDIFKNWISENNINVVRIIYCDYKSFNEYFSKIKKKYYDMSYDYVTSTRIENLSMFLARFNSLFGKTGYEQTKNLIYSSKEIEIYSTEKAFAILNNLSDTTSFLILKERLTNNE